jgi:hypothetical protein
MATIAPAFSPAPPGGSLHVEVDRQHERVAGRRLRFLQDAQLAAESVDLDPLSAVDAAQVASHSRSTGPADDVARR